MKILLSTVVCVLLFVFGCGSDDPAPPVQQGDMDTEVQAEEESAKPEPGLTYWYEDSNLSDIETSIDLIKDRNLSINIALHRNETDFDAVENLINLAQQNGLTINLWPLLPYDEGYFPNTRLADDFAAWCDIIFEELDARGLKAHALVIDLEPPIEVLGEIQTLFGSGLDVGAIKEFLVGRYDKAIYESGRQTIEEIITKAHELGYEVHASTLFIVLDDFQDGDDDIQRGFDVPIENMGFDKISFQLYRSAFGDYLGGGNELLSPHIVYDYALTAKEQFGDLAAVDLGLIGSAIYTPENLREDLAVSIQAGFGLESANIYALHSVFRDDDPSRWLNLEAMEPFEPETDVNTSLMRSFIQALDADVDLGSL